MRLASRFRGGDTLEVAFARLLDDFLAKENLSSALVWAVVSDGMLFVCSFIVDFGRGREIFTRWWPGIERSFSSSIAWVEIEPLPFLAAGVGIAWLIGGLSVRALLRGGGSTSGLVLLLAMVLPCWVFHALQLSLGDPALAAQGRFLSAD